MDGILPTEEFMEDEFLSLANEHKVCNDFSSLTGNDRFILLVSYIYFSPIYACGYFSF